MSPILVTAQNGFKILIEQLPHTHSVSLGCYVNTGSRHESARLSGVAHFIEHTCFKGTRSFLTARALSLAVEGVGGVLNASTSYESTTYWAKVADVHLDRALQVLSELVCVPTFDADEMEKERRVIIEELRGIQDDPEDWVHELLQCSMWGEQPLGRDIAGSIETVTAMRHSELVRFWQQHYVAQNLVVSIAGNVQTDAIVTAVEAAFASCRGGSVEPPLATQPAQLGPKLLLLPKDLEQANFALGFPSLSYNDPDRRPMQVLDTVLGGGAMSRLFQILREDHGLAYDVGSYHSEVADAGMWEIYGAVEPQMLRDTLVMVFDILSDLMTNGITDDELSLVKEQVKGGVLLSLEDTWSVASRNGSHYQRYGHVIPVEQVVAEVEAVSAADVLRVAQRVLRADAMHLAVIGPYTLDDKRELQTAFETGLSHTTRT